MSMTVGMIYNADLRNNGTAVYCWDSLKRGLGFGETLRRYRPDGILPKHDFYIAIDDGRDDIKWECPKPNAYWAVDTHLGFDYRLWKARQFDYVFCAQKAGAERMKAEGINAFWLPLACHPPAHPNREELVIHEDRERFEKEGGFDKKHDVVFVGYINEGAGPGSNNRLKYLDRLFKAFPNFWITTNCFHEDMAARYVRGRVGFNVTIRDDISMRMFEIPSVGTAMLSNRTVDGIELLDLIPDEDFCAYSSPEEMIDKTRWMLAHPLEREEMAARAHKKIRARHTYVHRMALLLTTCGVPVSDEIAALADGGFRTGKGYTETNGHLPVKKEKELVHAVAA